MALTDAMRVAELLKREGIPVPNPDREVLRTVAFREATELFQQNKFEEAAKKFEEAVSDKSGKTGDERDLEALYYATIAWCRANQFQRAADVAKRVVQIFPREMRAWDTVYNTGALALRFYTENRAQQPEQAEKAMTIGNELFLFLVEKNPTYPKAVNAVWQIAEGHWRDASNLSQEKKKLAQQLEQAQKDQQEKILNQIKKIDDEITLKYQEAIKIYELILKNYATSSYANVALYRLGWIQHLFRNREKAIEYFQQFVQKEGKVNSDVLDAMYLIGDSWFRLKRHDEAINQLQKVKDVLEKNQYVLPEDEKAAANAKSKIDRITKSTYTLLAWCYQDKGDSLLEQAESYRDQLNEIQDLIAQYRTSIEGAKDDNELLSLPPIPTGTPPVVSDRVEEGKLPDDFIFRSFLERAGLSVDLTMELPLMSEIHIRQGKVIIGWGPDVITSEDGTGFTVTVKGDRLLWDSVPVACYRRGKLLGIFDTVSRSFNSPKPEQQVPTAIEWPESFPPKIPVFAARIYLALLNARFRRVQQEVEKVRMEGMKWQQQALDQLIGFVKNPQYASDPHYAPRCLLLISSNYINRGEWEKASEYLNTLQKKFPQSEESQRAPIQLFRVLLEASKKAADPQKEKELREQAMKQTAFLKSDVGKLSMNNLRYLAFGLFSLNENQEYTNPAPDVSMAALDELLRRMGSEKTEENREDLNRLKEKVLYYKIVALTLLKRETEALSFIDKILAENQKSAYLFRLYQLKAGIYLEQKKYDDALIAVANITTKADRNNYKAEFWQGILLAGRIYLAKNTKPDVQKALLSFQNVVEYVDPKDEELQSIRESAYYYLAKCFALLGQREKAVEIQTRYLKEYPNGKWRKAIGNLPPSAF
ncbi:MAG: tetratricopeptide repeat protein [Candidatus Bathyarchaeia archaeon]